MVKLRAKNLLALALSILMLTGTVTDWLPTALAVEEPSAVTEQAAEPDTAAAQDDAEGGAQLLAAADPPARQLDFQDSNNGRPNLYVDFLGDNIGNGTATDSGHLVAPANYNKDNRTNPIAANTWGGYSSTVVSGAGEDNIIFWVGVGVDRTQVWELLKNSGNKGLTSLELGFYYNKKYIEPYTGGDFAATLTTANIYGYGDHNTCWGENYQILHAETDLPVEEKDSNILRADPITQDELENPSLDNIRANRYSDTDPATDADWRMTYISLEMKEGKENATRRLAEAYKGYQTDENGEPVIPPAAPGTGTTPPGTNDPPEYLLMIPFVVHQHDAQRRLCLRLVRDASHFSIGAGNDGVGDGSEGSYAAWERVTTRNEGKDLKLQLRFAGDLNIWNVDNARVEDKPYTATLLIQNGGGSQNTARLSVQGDTGGTPVFVDQNNQTIQKLQGGTGMELDVTVQSGYKVTVWVYYDGTETGDDGKPVQMGWPYTTVVDQEDKKQYTFVMPNKKVFVLVVFQPDNTRDFTLYLSEDPKPYTTGYMLGNETTVSSFFDDSDPKDLAAAPQLRPISINSFDPRESHPNDGHGDGPKMKVSTKKRPEDEDVRVTVEVSTHPDYEARVYIYNFNSQKNVQGFTTSAPSVGHEPDADGISTIIVLPFGGTVSFPMPQSDVDVVVEYTPADTKTAKLEVYHQDETADKVKDINIAQLAYLSYDKEAAVSTAYSGQVYEWVDPTAREDLTKRNHSAVKQPSYKTPWVPYSAATVSNSLGGDTGRTGRSWSDGAASLMATLANATSESNLVSRFTTGATGTKTAVLDLMGGDLLGDGSYMGLRKNLDGEPYGDEDLASAAALLWELRCKVMADVAASGPLAGYYANGTLGDGTTFHYFDLTPAQVQAYRIDCLKVDAIFRANQQAYRKAYQTYQEMKQIYDLVDAVIRDVTAPIAPLEPLGLQEDADIGLRKYQGTTYLDDYIADYNAYLQEYKDFITALRDAEGIPTATAFTREPKNRPDRVPVELLPDDSANPDVRTAKKVVEEAITEYGWGTDTEVEAPSAEMDITAAVSTRAGRTVWLLLEADSAYEVDHIELLDNDTRNPLKDPANINVTLEAKASTSFKNVYTFSMPADDCIVQVYYKLRSQRTLQWQVIGADGKEENVAHIEAYQVTNIKTVGNIPTTDPQWGNIYPVAPTGTFDPLDPNASLAPSTPLDPTRPTLAKRTNEGHVGESPYPSKREEEGFPVEGLLVGSQVTVRLTRDKDYNVTVTANNGSGGTPIYVDDRNAAAGIYTFTVPEHTNPNVVLTITYTKKTQSSHNAHIRVISGDGSYSSSNTGLWDNKSRDTTAMSGDALHGKIELVPGYYIDTSYAIGPYGSCPYTLDGNGYNNGLGAGSVSKDKRAVVNLNTVMPEFPNKEDELWIYIVVKKGLPPAEPGNALTIVVVDEDNTASPLADNWAKATVYPRNPRENDDPGRGTISLGPVSKKTVNATDGLHRVTHDGRSGDPILTGDRVELELSAANTFYVAEVALGPSYLGGDLEWLTVPGIDVNRDGTRKLQFTMPAGSTTVTVRFRKLDESITSELPSYYVYAQRIETDRNGALVSTEYDKTNLPNNNRITTATSGTIQRYATGGIYSLTSENQASPEQVPSSESGRGAGVAGETVTMTFQVKPGWYVQSVAVMTDGSARPLEYTVVTGDNNGGGGTFTADLVMPSGNASFIVKYRQCPENLPRPEIPEYAITLMVIDDDNTGDPPDPNTVTASFVGDEGFTHGTIHAGGNYNATAIQYIHAGDRVRLSHDLAPGYTLDYMIVNPTEQGIVPTYLDSKTSQFTMPARNITVIAKIVKGAQQQYTADLILRPPAGVDIDEVGQGTFTNLIKDKNGNVIATPSLTDYYANAIYSLLLDPGEKVDFDLYAFDGYYIRAVTVEPAVGADPSLTGSYGYQSGGFVMPAANVYVNVYFEKKWPQRGDGPEDDGAKFDLTLKVHDASAKENNYAYFDTYGGTDFPPEHQTHVHGGETHIVRQTVRDGQEIRVTLNRETGFYYDPSTIHVTDTSGAEISWRMTATGIAFLMPPRSTTVEITFRKDNRTDAENPARIAVLHINGTVKTGEEVKLYRKDGGTDDYASSDGGMIGYFGDKLRAGDLLHLSIVIPDASKATRRVAAAYAVDEATGDQLMLPVTQVSEGGLNSFPVPTLPAGADATKYIHVYVTLVNKDDGDVDQTMTLVVQGPSGSGTATLYETADTTNTVTATAGVAGPLPPDELRSPVGSIHAKQGSALTVNLDPVEGYYIAQLTVTDRNGNKVDYDWISMVEDEEATDPAAWYPEWKPNYDPTKSPRRQQITLLMPAIDGTVQVTYAKIPTDPDNPDEPIKYRAQVVVNDDEYVGDTPSRNNAWLSVAEDADKNLILEKLVTAAAGDWVDLDITVQAGYRIMPIFVSPQSFGIKPQLYLGDLDSQTTGFVMPAGDVTVYVRFVRDNLPIYNATLVVEGFRGKTVVDGLGSDYAKIHSDRTGTRGPIDSSKNPVSVQAAATREWVTVTYKWDDQSWVSSLTVKDRAGRNIPFTQKDENTITLPMVARDIIITVTYEDGHENPPPVPDDPPPDPTPELTPVRLHVIDMTNGSITTMGQGWGRVTHNGTNADVTQTDVTGKGDNITFTGYNSNGIFKQSSQLTALPIAPGETDAEWGHTETIWVPAGRTVTLEAFSDVTQSVYIHSAYVLYRDGGQMINCNLQPNNKTVAGADPGFYNYRTAEFQAHPDYNDVYVYLNNKAPTVNEYAATLMLKSPDGDIGSVAAIWTGTDLETTTNKASVKANGDHGRITAQRKDTVTITVSPAPGYAIDYILMTPLGVPITPQRADDGDGNEYTFTMPGYNVCACVYLKRSNERKFDVRVHYSQQWDPNTDLPGEHNRATVSWDPSGSARVSRTANRLDPNSTAMTVDENATVTLDVTLDDPYVVLAAYALQGGSIVPLAPALEGTKETRSMTDNSLPDGTATFTMPGGNVDVYVVTTNDPPQGVWHTAVLTVEDPDTGKGNLGISQGTITRDGTIDNTVNDLPRPRSQRVTSALDPVNHKFVSVREGQVVTVVVEENNTYTFDRPAQLTHAGSYGGTLRPVSSSATEHVYEFTVGNCNSAVLANFKAKEAETNPLTVIVEDPDNPGNTGVRQTTTVTAGTLPTLSLVSESYLGAYQVIPNVEDGSAITIRAEAYRDGEGNGNTYQAYAYWSYDDGTGPQRERISLTQTGNVYTGAITMPAYPATITVTYYKTNKATITIHDRNQTDQSSSATMAADILAETDVPPIPGIDPLHYTSLGSVTVNRAMNPKDTIYNLDTGTRLTTTVNHVAASDVSAVLATDASGTHFLDPKEDTGEYLWTVDKSDVDIVVIVDAKETGTHIASVVTRGKPASATNPTIAAAQIPDFNRSGSIWCTADTGVNVTVTVPPVDGYRVTVTARNVKDGSDVPVTAAGSTYTAAMPNANLEFTVTYQRTDFPLTLRVIQPNGTTNITTVTPNAVVSGTTPLTQDGHKAVVTEGTQIVLTEATPATSGVTLRSAYWTATDGTGGTLSVGGPSFPMPAANTVVTVVYGKTTPTPDDDPDYYTAWVAVKGDDDQPENRVNFIQNVSVLANTYPTGTPDWACGVPDNEMKLSISVKDGYYVTVTAETRNPDGSHKAPVPVIQQGDTGLCAASVNMPTPGEDVFITVTYKPIKDKLEPEPTNVTLVLVGHGGLGGNSATVIGGSLGSALSASGTGPNYAVSGDPTSRVYVIEGTAKAGEELRLSANWAADQGYQITRATLSMPKTAGATPDFGACPELPDCGDYIATELDLSRYGTNATARLRLPGEGAVITVYYNNAFEATFHVIRNGTAGDDTSATDDRVKTVTSTGKDPIRITGDRLISMIGGEEVQTTAKPNPDNTQRLVGVVWESATKGATAADPPADPTTDHVYTFTMQKEDVDFYAVYEPEPQNPKDRSYIAKVRFGPNDEHLGDSGNIVTITNTSDSAASHGTYWTAAKTGQTITVNVKVAEGYKAKIITTHEDKYTTHEGNHFDFYINRVNFLPTLTLGKDATFTMPEDTDATVIIEYIKGYDLELEVADTSGLAAGELNTALVTTAESPARTLYGQSDGTDITYDHTTSTTSPVLKAVDGGVDIRTDVTAGNTTDGKTAQYKVYYSTLFSGTERVDKLTGTPLTQPPSPYCYPMPSADVVESVIFYNNETPLLAKVEVKGESDINGNSATPIIDRTDRASATPKTTSGTVWTTTSGGNTIQLRITVAKDYVAKIKVRRDNQRYYENINDESQWQWLYASKTESKFQQGITAWDEEVTPAAATYKETFFTETLNVDEVVMGFQDYPQPRSFKDNIGGEEFFIFEMPTKDADGVSDPTDVTVIVEFEFAGTMPRPFNPGPDNMEMEKIDLDRGFIYGENRGDFALIDIPTLYQDSDKVLFDTDNYDKPVAGDKKKSQNDVKFNFFLYNADRDEYTPLTLGVDVLLEPEDEKTLWQTTDPYNYYEYKTKRATASPGDILDDNETANPENTYIGSRFKLIPTDADELTGNRTDGAQALYDMLNDRKLGSLEEYGTHKYRTRLYVMAEDVIGQKSAYTQVWVRPYFTITAQVISYAPNHTTTANLYKLKTWEELNEAAGHLVNGVVDPGVPEVTVDTGNMEHYRLSKDETPYLSNYTAYEGEVLGEHKYYQAVNVMSSELLGPYTKYYDPSVNLLKNVDMAKASAGEFTYALILEKPSSLTYTRVNLNLAPTVENGFDLSDPDNPTADFYEVDETEDSLTYTIADFIYLITGDVDGDGYTKWQDYDTVYTYVWRNVKYDNTVTKAPDPADPNYTTLQAAWRKSIYNPDTMAYRCDLNGDGVLTVQDVNIVQTVFDYNRSVKDYMWTKRSDDSKVLPFGFGKRDDSGYAALFALRETADVFPMERDEYWDSLVDPDTTEAPPLNTVYVDEDGNLWEDETPPEENETPSWPSRDTGGGEHRRDDAVMETPVGDEVMEWSGEIIDLPGFDPSPAIDLPFFDPEEPAFDLPQNNRNGPGEDPAETPAHITTEE